MTAAVNKLQAAGKAAGDKVMKKALVVDDAKNIRTLLKTSLEMEGFEVIAVDNGEKAVEVFEKEKLDIAFIDIKMSGMSGTEVLRKIRAGNINTPVIIMTAFATIKNAVECTRLGAVEYLQKPFTALKIKNVLTAFFSNTEKNPDSDKKQCGLDHISDLIDDNRFERAVELLKAELASDPSNPRTYLLLSKAYEGAGDASNASKFMEAYLLFKK